MECFVCGIKGEHAVLFDAVVRDGVVKICQNCSLKENIPLIRKPSDFQLDESKKNQTVYEKLSRMAGINAKEHKAKFHGDNPEMQKKDMTLKDISDRNYAKKIGKELAHPNLSQVESEQKADLIDNYHWLVLRARRARRLTQRQLAENIGEPEVSIKLLERGVLPDNYHDFIRKLETFLGIRIFNKPMPQKKEIAFDPVTTKELTISDLNEMKKEKKMSFFPYWRQKLKGLQKKRESSQEEFSEEDVNLARMEEIPEPIPRASDLAREKVEKENREVPLADKKELSQEDMDKIIFGK